MATFEEQLAALESVVERLERGELALDESVQLFEEGVQLSNACKKVLDAAEGRIQVLMDDGVGEQDLVLEAEEEVEREEDEE
ncbi:exodeoxyribonuclease VII small subunit [Granulicella sp. dw_53]|uniref:exodeoxyribonuclease VII small subunit n=1 Tax=Granulicella sp. dw_53 TaxID=2719792 RepID=UPI001BD33B07|nr:exodeoxyribonuclease VII small subunit [Granulicella sp. dw_53]